MPGIFGFVGAHDVTEDLLLLARMLRSVSHEPFYRTGTTFEQELGLGAGWALRGDAGAPAPPVWNHRHDICLIFSGEDFSAPPERRDSAAWLLERYEQLGEEFLTGSTAGSAA
jgi:hypothetical protein